MDLIACALRNLNVSDYSGPIQIKIEDKTAFHLIFKEKELLGLPRSYNYSLRFGADEVNRLLNNFVCFSINGDSVVDPSKRKILANNFFAMAQLFSNALWFVKDNAVTPYFATVSSNTIIEPISLRRNVYYSDAETKYEDKISFTTNEIIESMQWIDELNKFLVKKKPSDVKKSTVDLTNMSSYISFNIPSFQRAFYFLDVARKTDFLPSKIATYISVLEAFYAVEGDNKHKTSERTAFLIGKNGEDRIRIYEQISDAYIIRSKYVHGAYFSDDRNKKLGEVSRTLDNLVRKVFKEMVLNHKYLNYNSGKNQKVDKAFNEIVLSKE